MQKVFNARFITILIITALCVYLTLPTVRYFWFVSQIGDDPTPEQIAQRNKMLENPGVIKLGLDLQGGADFLIAVDVDSLARQHLENDVELLRSQFRKEDVDASVRIVGEKVDDLIVAVTVNDPQEVKIAGEIITSVLDQASNLEYEGDVNEALRTADRTIRLSFSTEGMLESQREAMAGALKVLKDRINKFGLTQPIVQRADRNRIRVQIPGENDPERIERSLLQTAELEFRLLHPDHDTVVQDFIKEGSWVPEGGTGIIKDEFLEEYTVPATGKMSTRLRDNIPNLPAGYTLRLGRKTEIDPATGQPIEEKTITNLVYVVRSAVPLSGAQLRRAGVYIDQTDLTDPVKVSLGFNAEGARTFCNITTENTGKRFAILLDDVVYSAPNINEPICGGSAVIEGGFSQAEAQDLSLILKAGALPAKLVVVERNTIGPYLGADSIRGAGKALIIGFIAIIIMMVFIYRTCGVISILAMTLNVLMIMAILSMMGATLTLSGIGGILLTMGMAVDANILIYERLREELAAGKPLRAAINTAFGRAYTVIFDSNITSLLPALVLVLFEVVSGSVKGFWVALSIGLLANLYTGVVVTRALVEAWYAKTRTVNVGTFHVFKKVNIPWMKYRKLGIAFSLGVTVLAAGYLAVKGPSYGIDFTGGVLSTVRVESTEPPTVGEISGLFSKEYRDVRVIKVVNREGQFQITVPQMENAQGQLPTLEEIRADVVTTIGGKYPGSEVLSSQSVDPEVGNEFRSIAIMSVIITCAVILTFLAFRFQWIFGAGAVLALLHDVFLALGVFKMFGHSLTMDIVSALLIILGYSVNDTIVVFDRIREKMQERLTGDVGDIINLAINETLNRTVLTSGSTFLAVLVMYVFGGSGLADFALILLLGIFFGTYSSIFIASGLVYSYLHHKGLTSVIHARKATTRVAVPKSTKKEKSQS